MNSTMATESTDYIREKMSRSFSGVRCIYDIAWSSDQSKLVVRGINKTYLWDLTSDTELWATRGANQHYRGISISPYNQYVILPANGESEPGQNELSIKQSVLQLLQIDNPAITRYVKDDSIVGQAVMAMDVAQVPNGSLIAAILGADSGWVGLFDPVSWKLVKHIGPFKNFRGIVVNPNFIALDSKRNLLIGGYVTGDVQVWNYETNIKIAAFHTSVPGIHTFALNSISGEIVTGGLDPGVIRFPDGHVAGGGDNPNELVKAWDVVSGKLRKTYSGTSYGINSVSVSPDGRYIAATEGGSLVGGHLLLWDAASGALLKSVEYRTYNGLNPVRFSPDSHHLAFGNDDEVQIYDLN